jgi:hypothetical protein
MRGGMMESAFYKVPPKDIDPKHNIQPPEGLDPGHGASKGHETQGEYFGRDEFPAHDLSYLITTGDWAVRRAWASFAEYPKDAVVTSERIQQFMAWLIRGGDSG